MQGTLRIVLLNFTRNTATQILNFSAIQCILKYIFINQFNRCYSKV